MIDIRSCTARLLKDKYQIEELVTEILFDDGILSERICRDTLIKEEYYNKLGTSAKQLLKVNLSDKYCVSLPSVEKIVLNHL